MPETSHGAHERRGQGLPGGHFFRTFGLPNRAAASEEIAIRVEENLASKDLKFFLSRPQIADVGLVGSKRPRVSDAGCEGCGLCPHQCLDHYQASCEIGERFGEVLEKTKRCPHRIHPYAYLLFDLNQ